MTEQIRKQSGPRALIYAPQFLPYGFSESITTGKLVLAFLNAGWGVRVMSRGTAALAYSTDWGAPWERVRPMTIELKDTPTGRLNRVMQCARHAFRFGFVIPGLRWVAEALEEGLRMHAENRFDLVISRSIPEYAHLAGYEFSRRTGVRWVANWNDPPASLSIPPYPRYSRPWPFSMSALYTAKMLKVADITSFPSERLRTHVMNSAVGNSHSRTEVIPHVAPPCMDGRTRQQDGVFRLCHAGHLDAARNPQSLFAGLQRFLNNGTQKTEVELLIVGTIPDGLTDLASKYGLQQCIRALGPCDYLTSLRQMAECDVLVILEAPCSEGIFLPGKLVDYASVGRPILAISPRTGTVPDLIARTGCGIAADCLDPESIAQALRVLYEAWKSGKRQFTPDKFLELVSPQTIVSQYARCAGIAE